MQNYFINPTTNEPLNLERDVVEASCWMQGDISPTTACGRHESGVWIFTHPEGIAAADEYADGDPYGAESELQGGDGYGFHQGRIDCAVNLICNHTLAPLAPPPQFNLLDIGCGEGHLTAQLKKQCPTIQTVYGIDMSLTACVKGKRLYPELEFIVGDAYSLPFQDKSFDIVLLNNIWEHVPDPCRMLSAAAPLMKDDGIVLISTPNRYRFTNIVRKTLTGRCKLVSTHHVTEYSQGQVEEQLEFMGFDVVEVASSPSGGSRYPVKFCSRVLRTLLCCTKSKLAFESTLFYIAKKKQSV